MDLARREGGDGMPGIREEEMMGGRRKPVGDKGAMSRHGIGQIPMDDSDWNRLLAWCDARRMKVGVVAEKALREFMRRRGI